MNQIARLTYENEVLRRTIKSLENGKKLRNGVIKKLKLENQMLREPFVAAVTVANQKP